MSVKIITIKNRQKRAHTDRENNCYKLTKGHICLDWPGVSPTAFDWTHWSQSRPFRCAWHFPWSQSSPGMAGSSWARSRPVPRTSEVECRGAYVPTGLSAEQQHWSQCPKERHFKLTFPDCTSSPILTKGFSGRHSSGSGNGVNSLNGVSRDAQCKIAVWF